MKVSVKKTPFLSNLFIDIWLKYFNKNKLIKNNPALDLLLLKHKCFPYYFNVGKNFTNGINYNININNIRSLYKKTILIYDIPEYFDCFTEYDRRIKIKKIRQYGGVLTNLENYSGIEDLLQNNFKSKKRAELKKFKRRLELCYDVQYFYYYGEINRAEYEKLFKTFYILLKKRYDFKGISNRNLNTNIKSYYYELIFSLIKEKKALFFVIKVNGAPVSMSLSFVSSEVLFYAIPVFDIDFSKFNLGHISIMALLDWCFVNKIKVFDFSKGDGVYKDKWVNYSYNFTNHIIYDSKNYFSVFTASSLYRYFKIKQQLRDLKVNSYIQKLTFKFKNKKPKHLKYKVSITPHFENDFKEIYNYKFDNSCLNLALNDFLYANSSKFSETTILEHVTEKNLFIIKFDNYHQSIITN